MKFALSGAVTDNSKVVKLLLVQRTDTVQFVAKKAGPENYCILSSK